MLDTCYDIKVAFVYFRALKRFLNDGLLIHPVVSDGIRSCCFSYWLFYTWAIH